VIESLRNAGLRLIIALLLSFVLWVFVSYTQNPDRRTSFDGVPVEIFGLPADMLIVESDGLVRTTRPTVRVTVESDAATLTRLRGASDLRAFVDMRDVTAGEYVLTVNVETTRADLGRLRFEADPTSLAFRVEQEITRTVPLTVSVVGIVPFSFEADEPSTTSQGRVITEVLVRGPQSRVERVLLGRAVADIDRLTANYNSPRPVVPIDAGGQQVAGVTVIPATVDLLVPIRSSVGIKRVPILPTIIGDPAPGFIVSGVTVEPQLVNLTGSSGALDAVNSVQTVEVSVNGASSSFTRIVAIREPARVRLSSGEPAEVVVNVRISPIERPFTLNLPVPVIVTDVEGDLIPSINTTTIPITLSGTAASLASIDLAQLAAVVSAQDLRAGIYVLTPTLQLPANVRLVGEIPRVTLILRAPFIPTPTPEPTETPTVTPEATETPTVALPEEPTPAPP
jgi:YbbR domain-containing protein